MPPRLSVIIPAFNEAESLQPLVPELLATLRGIDLSWEILLLDDGSTDATPDVIQKFVEEEKNIRGLILASNTGKGGALALGFSEAAGDIIVTMDGDLQDVPANIPLLLGGIDRGADVVIGWKQDRADPWSRRVTSALFNVLSCKLLGTTRLHDVNSGMKAYRRHIVQNVPLHGSMFRFLTFFLLARGHRLEEVPVPHRPRVHGQSRFSVLHRLRSIPDLFTAMLLIHSRGALVKFLTRRIKSVPLVRFREVRSVSAVVQH